jgi:tetratricopeptide (TPR) repeat protein
MHIGPSRHRGTFIQSAAVAIAISAAVATATACGSAVRLQGEPKAAGPAANSMSNQATSKPSGAIEKELEGALVKVREGKLDEALGLIKPEAAKHPEWAPPRLILARMLFNTDQAASGRQMLEKAAIESPDYPDIYFTFGALALAEGRVSDARLNFDHVLKLVENGGLEEKQASAVRREAYAGLGTAAEAREDWKGALAEFNRCLEIEPKNGPVRQRVGRVLFRLGKFDEAYNEMARAVKDTPSLEPAAVAMGLLYSQSGNAKKAAEWFDVALKKEPDNPRARIAQATWLLEQGNARDARNSAELAVKLAPDSKEGRRLQALIAWHLRDLEGAEKFLEPLHRDSPADVSLSSLLALALVEQDDPTKRARGLRLAAVSAQQSPRSHEVLATLGWAQYRNGHLDQAEQALRVAVMGVRTTPDIAYFLARVLFDKGNRADARKVLESVAKLPGAFAHRDDAATLLNSLTN